MPNAIYRFSRAESRSGFQSPNSTSTDAQNAVAMWTAGGQGRRFAIVEEQPDALIAQLFWDASEHAARDTLADLCTRHGVERELVPT